MKIKEIAQIIIGVVLLSAGVTYAATWTAPAGTFPNGNVDAPINTGNVTQTKNGDLRIASSTTGKKVLLDGGAVWAEASLGTNGGGYFGATAANTGVRITNGTKSLQLFGGTVGTGSFNGLVQSGDNAIVYYGGALSIVPWAAGSSGIRMDTSGNVGVGIAAPTQKLDVNGSVKGNQLCIGSDCRSSWPAGASGGVSKIIAGTGSGITVSPAGGTGDVTIGTNFGLLQKRVAQSCLTGQAIKAINADGSVSCINVISQVYCGGNSQFPVGSFCQSSFRDGSSYTTFQKFQCTANGTWSVQNEETLIGGSPFFGTLQCP